MGALPAGPGLVERLTAALPAMVDDLGELVSCESPSADQDAVAASAKVVAELGRRLLGRAPERVVIDGCTHLRWDFNDRTPGRGSDRRSVLLLGHHDTVWPLGSLASHPWSVVDGVARGPGCFDMKAGLVQALHALSTLDDPAGVTVLVTGDEELGSPSSRALIEQCAAGCAAAFVPEASAGGGALKTERKGTSIYRVAVRGRAAHAGLEPERGINAGVELAHQVLALTTLGDPSTGTTVTPTVLSAGSTTNTVPATAQVSVDVRARLVTEQARVDAAVRALRPVLDGAALTVRGGPNRPPLERESSASLFELAQRAAERLAIGPLLRAAVGGGSDGNFTAGAGTPTLDGLGAVGGGAHADDEHVLVNEMPRRAALLAALIDDVRGGHA
jgi:glutamate carboxypeptidase